MIKFTNDFQSRPIVAPRYLDEIFLRIEGFALPHLLRDLQLDAFTRILCPIYPQLVKVFFCNFKYHNKRISSEVKKIKIDLGFSELAELTSIPLIPGRSEESLEDFEKTAATWSVLREGGPFPTSRFKVGYLSVENRLLHYILCRVLLPRNGNYATVSEEDLLYMWALNKRVKLNWAYRIMKHMERVSEKPGPALPYAMLITKILEKFNVPLEGENSITVTDANRIREQNLRKMGLKKVDMHWVRDAEDEEFDDQSTHHHMEEDQPPSNAYPSGPMPDYSHGIAEIMTGLHSLTSFVKEDLFGRVVAMETHLHSMDARLERLETSVGDLTSQMTDVTFQLNQLTIPADDPTQHELAGSDDEDEDEDEDDDGA